MGAGGVDGGDRDAAASRIGGTPERQVPDHRDEAAVRDELTRAFTVCSSCRQCVDLCAAFPRLFERLEALGTSDPGMLTPLEQDLVVDACHQCDRCTAGCPFAPDRHEDAVDVAGLMTLAKAMQRACGHRSVRDRLTDHLLDPAGRVGATAGRALAGAAGVVAVGLPRRRNRQSFSAWFGSRPTPTRPAGARPVILVPTCIVEHHDPDLGAAAVEVVEAAAGTVELSAAGCCGAYWLQVGDLDRYVPMAEAFTEQLADRLRSAGASLVVTHPTCLNAIVRRSPELVRSTLRSDAEFIAGAAQGVAEFVLEGDPSPVSAALPGRIVFSASCHGTVTGDSRAAVELLRRAGADVSVVEACQGVGGTWGARVGNSAVAGELGARSDRTCSDAIGAGRDAQLVGDCPEANDAVARRTGGRPVHAVTLLARAVGEGWNIAPESSPPG